jgi:hypothetical protein
MTVVSFDLGLMAGTGLGEEAGALLFFVFKHVLPKLIWFFERVIGPNVQTAKERGRRWRGLPRVLRRLGFIMRGDRTLRAR